MSNKSIFISLFPKMALIIFCIGFHKARAVSFNSISVHIGNQQIAPAQLSQVQLPPGWTSIPNVDKEFEATDGNTSILHIFNFTNVADKQNCFNVAVQAYQLGSGFTVSGTGASELLPFSNTEIVQFTFLDSCVLDAAPAQPRVPPASTTRVHINSLLQAPAQNSQQQLPPGWNSIPDGDKEFEVTDANTSIAHIIFFANLADEQSCFSVALQAYRQRTGFTVSGIGGAALLPYSNTEIDQFTTLHSCALDATPATVLASDPVPAITPDPPIVPGHVPALVANSCTPKAQLTCAISGGKGTKICANDGSSWGACTVKSCNLGYAPSGNSCLRPSAGIDVYLVQLYRGLLGRGPDAGGYNFWKQNYSKAGCAQVAAGFLSSSEFQKRSQLMTDQKYLRSIYVGLLGRNPDAGGLAYWLNALASGLDRKNAASSFLDGSEFNQDCIDRYGFPGGN